VAAEPRNVWLARGLAAVLCLILGGLGGLWMATVKSDAAVPVRFYPPPERQADFRLRDQDGKVVRLQRERGKVVVLTFLYATCWDLCPAQADIVTDALRRIDRRKTKDVEVLVISVDAVGDTPTRARRFVADHFDFGGRTRWLLGARRDLEPVWRMYGIAPIDATDEEAAESAIATDQYYAMTDPEEIKAADANYKPPVREAPPAAEDQYPAPTDLAYRGPARHVHGLAYEHSAYVMLIDKHGRQRVGFPFEQLDAAELARDVRTLVNEAPEPRPVRLRAPER
jgi:cytochrome oxidase Cu insertion factor (SCO1/SenC/PrrC family)